MWRNLDEKGYLLFLGLSVMDDNPQLPKVFRKKWACASPNFPVMFLFEQKLTWICKTGIWPMMILTVAIENLQMLLIGNDCGDHGPRKCP